VFSDVMTVLEKSDFFRIVADVAELTTNPSDHIVGLSVDEVVQIFNVVDGCDRVFDYVVYNSRHIHGRPIRVGNRRSLYLHGVDSEIDKVLFNHERSHPVDTRFHFNSEDLSEDRNDDSLHGVYHIDSAAPGKADCANREQDVEEVVQAHFSTAERLLSGSVLPYSLIINFAIVYIL